MPDWDQLSIETPELVAIDMPVAGIGSRFVALLVDYLIWLVAIVALILIFNYVDPSLTHFSKIGEKWAEAILTLIGFALYWGYFTLFEAFWNGRTPGKRLARIRVIQRSGRGIGLFEAMTRNLLRVVDQFPLVYAVGVITIFLTKQHQRLGDLAAGTLVVHEREQFRNGLLGKRHWRREEERHEGRRRRQPRREQRAENLQRHQEQRALDEHCARVCREMCRSQPVSIDRPLAHTLFKKQTSHDRWSPVG